MPNTLKAEIRIPVITLALLFLMALIPASGGTQTQKNPPADNTQAKGKVVYVCACLKAKSCSCMTEAKTEGPCSCGTEGGPPMKAVPKDGAWAKTNREELAK
jgi:hypothetical protein